MTKMVLFLLLLTLITNSILEVDTNKNITIKQFQQNSLVRVTQSSKDVNLLSISQIRFFSLSVTHKQKRKGYDLFKNRYDRILFILKKFNILQSQSQLIKSKLKSKFYSRTRIWQFGIIFAVECPHCVARSLENISKENDVKVLKNEEEIKYLEEKWMASKIFDAARLKLQLILESLGGQYQIKYLDDVEIDSLDHISDLNKLQNELQQEIMHLPQISNKNSLHLIYSYGPEQNEINIQMQIVFRVGKKKQQDTEFAINFTYVQPQNYTINCSNLKQRF